MTKILTKNPQQREPFVARSPNEVFVLMIARRLNDRGAIEANVRMVNRHGIAAIARAFAAAVNRVGADTTGEFAKQMRRLEREVDHV
jgi:hypothetical protein